MSLITDSATAIVDFESDACVSAWPVVRGESPSASSRASRGIVADWLASREIEFISSDAFSGEFVASIPTDLDEGRLLTAEEETALFRQMNYLKYRARDLVDELRRGRLPTRQAWQVQKLMAEADQIRNQLLHVFSKLAISIVRSIGDCPLSYDELLSEAHVALLRAVEKFDADRGYRFSTYATHAVRRSLYRVVNNQRRDGTRMLPTESLDVADARRRDSGYQRQLDQLVTTLNVMMDRLEPREQFIIRSRFGLSESPGEKTLQTVADELGLSRERVRQLECRAIQRLSEMACRENLALPGH